MLVTRLTYFRRNEKKNERESQKYLCWNFGENSWKIPTGISNENPGGILEGVPEEVLVKISVGISEGITGRISLEEILRNFLKNR